MDLHRKFSIFESVDFNALYSQKGFRETLNIVTDRIHPGRKNT